MNKVLAAFAAVAVLLFGSPACAGFLYLLNDDLPAASGGSGNRIYGFSVNETSGALTPLAGFPIATGGYGRNPLSGDEMVQGLALYHNAATALLFSINPNIPSTNTLSAFTVDRTSGSAKSASYSPIPLPAPLQEQLVSYTWSCVTVHPSGSPVIVAEPGNQYASFVVGPSSVQAAAGSPFNPVSDSRHPRPFSCAFSGDGNTFYAGGNWITPDPTTIPADGGPNQRVQELSVDPASGVLGTSLSSIFDICALTSCPNPRDFVGYVPAPGRRMLLASMSTPEFLLMNTSGGDMTSGWIDPSGLSADSLHQNARFGLMHPAGYYVVAAPGTQQIGVFNVPAAGATPTSSTLGPVAGSPFATAGLSASILATNANGRFLYAADANARMVSTFAFDGSTGNVTPIASQAANTLGTTGIIIGMSYLPNAYKLDVSASYGGIGTVVSNPAGISCRTTCSSLYDDGTLVTLTAVPDSGTSFTGWSGACSGTGTCTVTMSAARSVTANFVVTARLFGLSTRMKVLTGDDVLIGGFAIGGAANKTVVVRARGPSLAANGITNYLANPTLTLVDSSANIVATNDDWGTAPNATQIQASGYAPGNSLESAVMMSLPPGAYTAIVQGVGGGTGVGIVEVYEVDNPQVPLSGISTRGQVLTGNDVMIGGFIIQGSTQQTVIVRARGASLAANGISDYLANPTLRLIDGSGNVVATNDDWGSAPNAAQIQASGYAPADSLESAIMMSLPPGAYTAIVQGAGGGTGVSIVEVYNVQ